MRANSAADARQRVRIARQSVRFFKSPLCDQANISSGIRMRRTGHHAGEIGVQPIRVNLLVFESLQHRGTFYLARGTATPQK
jgi:hypothetical protein